MVKIIAGRTTCTITGDDDVPFLQALDRELSFKVQGAEHTWAYKQGQWNGIKNILTSSLSFPYGLLERVKGFYKKHGRECEIVNKRPEKTPCHEIDIRSNLIAAGRDPYPYQWDTLEAFKKHDCGIVRMATGAGKCNCIKSLNFSEFGLLSYEELLADKKVTLKPQESVAYESKIATPLTYNHLDKTSMIYRDGFGKSRHIKTRYGYELKATPEHRIKILTNDGIVWKRCKDLQVGDYTVISNNINVFGNKSYLSLDEAYWCGLLLGDGGFSNMNYVGFTNEDDHLLGFVRSFLEDQNLKFIEKNTKNSTYDIRINNVVYRKHIMNKYGFKPCLSIYKEIPVELRKLTKPLLAMVIRGLYETDGWVGKGKSKPTINIALSSKQMIDQLHLILLNYGIVASRRIKKTTHEDSHQLTIYREFIPKFIQEIGFDPDGRKFKEINEQIYLCKTKVINLNTNLVFNQKNKIRKLFSLIKKGAENISLAFNKYGIIYRAAPRSWAGEFAWRNPSKEKLKEVLCASLFIIEDFKFSYELKQHVQIIVSELLELCSNKFFFDPIISIEESYSDNYDFVVPDSHSFVSQGFVNHNTVIASMAIAHFGKRAIIYVIGKSLLYQIHEFFSEIFDDEIGIIGDSQCEIRDINVCSVWTIGQALGIESKNILLDTSDKEKALAHEKYKDILDLMRTAKVHIFDECHLASCDTIQQIASKINPEYVYGMSASPWRDDGSDLLIEGIFGSTIVDVSASYLIKNGYLAKPIIKFQRVPKMTFSKKDTYPSVYKQYISENEARNKLIIKGANTLVDQGFKPLVLFSKLKHGKLLYDEIKKDLPCMLLSGKDSAKIRDQARNKIETGEIKCIVASTIFDIGVDIPALSGLIIAGGGKSSVRALQRIGRVIRKYPGKDCAAVIEFLDQAKFLKSHSAIRYKIYATEEEFDLYWPK